MPDLNENMDQLMRRAAGEYPLRVSGQDWQKIAGQINSKKRRRRPWLWFVLPLAAGIVFIGLYNYNAGNFSKGKLKTSSATTSPVNEHAAPGPRISASQETGADSHQLPSDINQSEPLSNTSMISASETSINNERPANNGSFKGRANMNVTPPGFATKHSTGGKENSGNNNRAGADKEPVDRTARKEDITVNEVPVQEGMTGKVKMEVVTKESDQPGENESRREKDTDMPGAEPENQIAPPAGREVNSIPVMKEEQNKIKDKPSTEEKEKKQTRKHFYAGITGGFDVSSVKLQGFDRTGTNYGLVAGLQLNDKWAVEAGVAVNRKYYNTDGKYFKGPYPLPYTATIESAAGDCNMLDFPVTARYTINPGKKVLFSLNAGFSSYLMQEETYTYMVNHNGVRYPRTMYYSNTEFTPFAVFTTGAGIGFPLGKITIGAEPYLRLPLREMGTGKLPLQSVGANLRATFRIN